MPRLLIILLALAAGNALAGPYVPAGDLALRHDIQRLADAGVIRGPVMTWPIAWGPVLESLSDVDITSAPPDIADAVLRIQRRANWETRGDELTFNAKVGVADNRPRIRSFQETPRGRGEASVGASWTGSAFSADLNVQVVDDARDSQEIRGDNSFVGLVAGNWSFAASTQNRWWGPGWDGSLILSDNARPFPALTIDRVFTDAFKTRWLSWLGPWDLTAIFGQLEHDRVVPDTRFFGLRFSFRPLRSLQIGVSRTAQWCGEGRPCDLSTLGDLLVGNDNRGDGGITVANEPGNQLAAVDFRWSSVFGAPLSLYGDFTAEDEAGGFPSRYIGLVGADWSGTLFGHWSTRVYAEYAGTASKFYSSEKLFNYAYNHGIYQTGYRYRGAAIGHGADNDSKLVSVGVVMVNADDTQWRALARAGTLNDGGPPDVHNTLTATPQDIGSVDITHSRAFSFGVIEAGAGYEHIKDALTGSSNSEIRFHLQWRSSY